MDYQNTNYVKMTVNILYKNDIIFPYETWANEFSDFNINGYTCFNYYRKFKNKNSKKCSGGTVLYVKDSVSKGIKVVQNHYDTII